MTATGLVDFVRRGAHDDGREGVVLAKIAAGELVKVPFGSGAAATSGGLAHVIGGGSAGVQSNLASNPDGSGTGVNFSIPAGLGQGAAWTEVLYGSTIGVRWRRNTASTNLPFGVVIDGVAYSMRNSRIHFDSVIPSSTADHEALWIVAQDLDPLIPHTVKIVGISDPYGAVVKSFLAYGWLLEASRGYKQPPRWGSIGAAAALVASPATSALSATSVLRKILLHNSGASTRVVSLKVGATVLKVKTLPAGTSDEIDFGVPVVLTASYTLSQDAGTDVTWAPVLAEAR